MQFKKIVIPALLGLTLLGGAQEVQANSHFERTFLSHATSKVVRYSSQAKQNDGHVSTGHPTKSLAQSVITPNVKKKLGVTEWNSYGAYTVNGNRTELKIKRNARPYAVNSVDKYGRPTTANAVLNKTTRQYQNRSQTGNGATNWRPRGFMQVSNLSGTYSHAYDRGHLLGYALIGGIKGFDASESNPKNIVTQTAWSNEARSATNTGQNYYEGLVRKGLDQNKLIRYRVTPVYQGKEVVPRGMHLEAKSTDGTVQFNVFVPNVQNGLKINYETGRVTSYVKR